MKEIHTFYEIQTKRRKLKKKIDTRAKLIVNCTNDYKFHSMKYI